MLSLSLKSSLNEISISKFKGSNKGTGRIPGWGEIYSQLSIYFEERI